MQSSIRLVSIFLLSLCYMMAAGQNVKAKKDEIYVDKEHVLRIVKIDTGEYNNWVVVSLQQDTLMTLTSKRIELPVLPHESFARYYKYYVVETPKSGVIGYMVYRDMYGRKNLAQRLYFSGLMQGKEYVEEKEKEFVDRFCDFSQKRLDEVNAAVERRIALRDDKEYHKHLQHLVKRNASMWLEVKDNKVYFSSDHIANIVIKDSDYGLSHLFYNPKGEGLASVFYEKGRNRVFVKTYIDDVGREYFIDHPFNARDLFDAVAFLVDNAYL